MRGFNFMYALLMGRRVCGKCGGKGVVIRPWPERGGYRDVEIPCPVCKGSPQKEPDHANRQE